MGVTVGWACWPYAFCQLHLMASNQDKIVVDQRASGSSDCPNQPRKYKYPFREFGKRCVVRRAFNPSSFDAHPWLHYDEGSDVVFCYYCQSAIKQKKVFSTGCAESAFTTRGYCDWKNAKAAFNKHEVSKIHLECTQVIKVIPQSHKNCGDLLSEAYCKEKIVNRCMFAKILTNMHFLARQGLPIRGDGDENESNFIQLLKLRGRDDSRVYDWLKRKTNKYTSPEVQNEIFKIMYLEILRRVSKTIRENKYFTIMADETTDCSNKEQLVLVLRWIDTALTAHEEFMGLYCVPQTDANTIVTVIKDSLIRFDLNLSNARGQCYDGAASMSGKKSGVAKQIMDIENRALFTHCYGHALNLACVDLMKSCKVISDTFDAVQEIIKNL